MSYYADGTLASGKAALVRTGFAQWMATDGLKDADLAGACSAERLQAGLSHLENVEVVSAAINRTGEFLPPKPHWIPNLAPPPQMITELPPYCDVLVHQRTAGDHVAKITIWVPLAWNRRFLATGGMGSVTGPLWFDQPTIRTITMPTALRNGFATAATDAGNRDPRFFEWPLDPNTGELDQELLRNWAYRSTHDMAVVAKAVIAALQGAPPTFSYFAGCSGGGRQGLAAVQKYPEDFCGVWASDPALNWTALWPSATWPALVMKELNNPLSEVKLEAFRAAAVAACDGADGLRDGVIGLFEMLEFDPFAIIGQPTAEGPITASDAEVMQKIWDGPRRADGERLGFGLPPGTYGWGMAGIWKTKKVKDELVPLAREGEAYFRWVLEDPDFDWRTMDFSRFEELTDLGCLKLKEFACNDPDLASFQNRGGKLLISQAVNDPVIPFWFVQDYYQKVIKACGGAQRTQDFARLFLTDGDIHGTIAGPGPGLTSASAMTALMQWVEDGKAPDMIVAERVDMASAVLVATRPAYPFPTLTRYSGNGDPCEASSYFGTTGPAGLG